MSSGRASPGPQISGEPPRPPGGPTPAGCTHLCRGEPALRAGVRARQRSPADPPRLAGDSGRGSSGSRTTPAPMRRPVPRKFPAGSGCGSRRGRGVGLQSRVPGVLVGWAIGRKNGSDVRQFEGSAVQQNRTGVVADEQGCGGTAGYGAWGMGHGARGGSEPGNEWEEGRSALLATRQRLPSVPCCPREAAVPGGRREIG
jgi:hypothetical protein